MKCSEINSALISNGIGLEFSLCNTSILTQANPCYAYSSYLKLSPTVLNEFYSQVSVHKTVQPEDPILSNITAPV